MTKEGFYKELIKFGFNIDDDKLMGIIAKALANYGSAILETKKERCEICYFKDVGKDCIKELCPQFNIPDDPMKAVEYEFENDLPFDFKNFVLVYIIPICIDLGYINKNILMGQSKMKRI